MLCGVRLRAALPRFGPVAFTVLAQGEVSAPAGASTGSVAVNPWADKTVAVAWVQEYLLRDRRESTLDTTREFPVIDVPVKMTNATHHLRIVIDTKRQIVYMFLNRYLEAKPDSARTSEGAAAADGRELEPEHRQVRVGQDGWRDPALLLLHDGERDRVRGLLGDRDHAHRDRRQVVAGAARC